MSHATSWTPREDALVLNRQLPVTVIAERLGRTRRAVYQRREVLKGSRPPTIPHVVSPVRPSPCALAERDRIAELEHRSLTALVLGDPLPGRSALDRRIDKAIQEGIDNA